MFVVCFALFIGSCAASPPWREESAVDFDLLFPIPCHLFSIFIPSAQSLYPCHLERRAHPGIRRDADEVERPMHSVSPKTASGNSHHTHRATKKRDRSRLGRGVLEQKSPSFNKMNQEPMRTVVLVAALTFRRLGSSPWITMISVLLPISLLRNSCFHCRSGLILFVS